MPRPFNQVPVYKLHSSTGNARCWVGGRWVTLGKYNSPESRAEFARICAELASAAPAAPSAQAASSSLTVDQVLLAFLEHADRHYRGADGAPTDEVRELKRSFLHVHRLYGHTPAAQFGPRALATVRQAMIAADWCRTLINRRVDRIKRAFKWAASQELVPVAVYEALRTLTGLYRGRTEARESEPVRPVDPAHVAACLPFLTPHLQALVRFQRFTGCRPGEACQIRLCDIDRTGAVWLYRPATHKTAHLGRDRVIAIGPQARAVLEGFLETHAPPSDAVPLFSPFRAREERFARMRANRKTKVSPSQMSRRKKKPKLVPAAAYTTHSYTVAVHKAAERAKVSHWHPNQLRHLFATEVRKSHGLEAAQVLLGHARADVTQVYAEKNLALAVQVAAAVG